MMRTINRILFAALCLALAVGTAIYFAARQRPTLVRNLTPVAISPAAVKSFDQKAVVLQQAADKAQQTGKPQPVTVTFTETELTSKAAQALRDLPDSLIKADNLELHLVDNGVIATSTIDVAGIPVSIAVVAEPLTIDGTTTFVIKDIKTGAIALPDSLRAQIDSQLQQQLSPATLNLPFDVTGLEIENGQLVLQASVNP
ncbi:MAG: hypothetical protein DWI67_07745 [Chloroflexi bacterium]|nr:MAG: hypothetical protein DWI67_07745 [Chloroflexota bacterium]